MKKIYIAPEVIVEKIEIETILLTESFASIYDSPLGDNEEYDR